MAHRRRVKAARRAQHGERVEREHGQRRHPVEPVAALRRERPHEQQGPDKGEVDPDAARRVADYLGERMRDRVELRRPHEPVLVRAALRLDAEFLRRVVPRVWADHDLHPGIGVEHARERSQEERGGAQQHVQVDHGTRAVAQCNSVGCSAGIDGRGVPRGKIRGLDSNLSPLSHS